MMARRPALDAVLAGGPLPDGLPAPAELLPPATAGEADVDAFLALLADRQRTRRRPGHAPPVRPAHRPSRPPGSRSATAATT